MFPGLGSLVNCGLGQDSGDLQGFLAVLFAASANWTMAGECDEYSTRSGSTSSTSCTFVSGEGLNYRKLERPWFYLHCFWDWRKAWGAGNLMSEQCLGSVTGEYYVQRHAKYKLFTE